MSEQNYQFIQSFQKKIHYFDEMIRLCEANPEINKSIALSWILQRNLVLEMYAELQKDLHLSNLDAKPFEWNIYYQGKW